MTALERAARAAYESPYGPQRLWDDLSEVGKELARNQVRAVLMAVRDAGVSGAMNDARDREIDRAYPYASPEAYGGSDNQWRAMIDAILNEKDTTND